MKFSLGLALAAATAVVAQWSGNDEHGVGHSHHSSSHSSSHSWSHKSHRNHWASWGHRHGSHPPPPGECPPSATRGNTTFTQPIDHKNPSLGTFEQFYFWDTTYWKGPGSPVIFFTPGEINGTKYTSYLTTNRTTGVLAQKIGAATIVMEHRYWGVSSPYEDLSTENLQHLTLENSMLDFTRFAKKAQLPFAKHGSNAADVPWVIMGGSYSGALSAWIESTEPGVFWAYHSSSAPVQAVSDYFGYFIPIMEAMPKNCSADTVRVTEHMTDVFTHGSAKAQHDLKAKFGLQDLHNEDVMETLANIVQSWQSNQLYTEYSAFYQWCDAIEGVFNKTGAHIPDANGVGLKAALNNWADWFKNLYLPGYCEGSGDYPEWQGENNTKCFDTYDATSPLYTDHTLGPAFRQWMWMLCNEPFGYWQGGAPDKRPFVASSIVRPDYFTRQCALYFPDGPNGETYGLKKGKTEGDLNRWTKGWNDRKTTRLIYANGQWDPWRESGVSAIERPGGPMKSTKQTPINVVPHGFHTSDLITKNGVVNAGAQAVIDAELAQLEAWVKEFPKRHHWSA